MATDVKRQCSAAIGKDVPRRIEHGDTIANCHTREKFTPQEAE